MTTRPTYRGTSLSCPTCHETYTALGPANAAEQAAALAGPTCCQTSRPASLGEDDQGGNHPSATEPTADTPGAPAAGAPRWGAGAPAISLAAVALYVGVPCVWVAFLAALIAWRT